MMVQCRRCAMPNRHWKPFCARCGASLHSWREAAALVLALLGAPLFALLLL
jgi:uncharacterized paraquat-inducible protein A